MTICILVRHGETTFNVEGRINGDPSIPVPLNGRGREEATQLARHIAHVRIDVCVHTRFQRTLETARLGLGARTRRSPWFARHSSMTSKPAIWRGSR
jgi:broad specificity phosphatase PhoE